MAEVKEVIANNISRLRKASGMSQAALANKVHYTDKAISKWERAESTPDVESLVELSKIFNVSIQYLFEEHLEVTTQTKEEEHIKKDNIKAYAIFGLCITAIWFICLVGFLYGVLTPGSNLLHYSLAFVWAIPISSFFSVIFGNKRKRPIWTLVSACLLLWTLIAAIYGTIFVSIDRNIWYLFIVGIPLQIAIILISLLIWNR